MTQGPIFKYREMIASGELKPDPAQEFAAERLQSLHNALLKYTPKSGKKGWMQRFGLKADSGDTPPQGIYLYGGVGRGKSMLMDLLFHTVPIKTKDRVHFHSFMRDLHAEIHRMRQLPGDDVGDPIPGIADGIADNTTLLCFDEMEVRDIADAMIVGRLFQKLFERGVVVVTTSNRHPDDLYKDGLQREKFSPFIALMKTKLDVVALESLQDYRLGRLMGSPVYYAPLGPAADKALNDAWARLTDDAPPKRDHLTVHGRRIEVPAAAHQVARFSFSDLCQTALGPTDYLAIAGQFATIIMSNIPQMNEETKDAARRFVTFIDALYEHRTVLICSAAVAPQDLYQGKEGGFEFHRTVSRLIEMQAVDYIKQRHVE